jgi:hypothetical protein
MHTTRSTGVGRLHGRMMDAGMKIYWLVFINVLPETEVKWYLNEERESLSLETWMVPICRVGRCFKETYVAWMHCAKSLRVLEIPRR